MKIKEIEFLMNAGMIAVDDDNIEYVVEALKYGGFEVEQ